MMKPRTELSGPSNVADRRRLRRKPLRTARQRPVAVRNSRKRLRRLLVPVDFSTASLRALDYATERARETGAAIILLHVLPPMVVAGRYEAAMLQSLKLEARRDTKQRLEKLAEERAGPEVPVKPWLLEGMAGERILQAAKMTNSDTIIMGSVGRKGIRRVLLGSVAEAVMRHADVPVTIVREPRKKRQKAGQGRSNRQVGRP